MNDLQNVVQTLDELLKQSDLSKVTASGAGFEDLPEGYYLIEIVEAKLTSTKESGAPMVSLKGKVIEDGWKRIDDDNVGFVRAKGTKNRTIYKNYVLTSTQDVNRFVSDMLKFEMPENPGEPLLPKEYFTTSETLLDALDIIATGSRIYILISSYEKNGEKKITQNLVKWSVIEELARDYNIEM